MVGTMRLVTIVVLFIWQISKLLLIFDRIRFRKRQAAFWDRHDKNMAAIRNHAPEPFPNNCHDWKPTTPTTPDP